MIIFLLIAKSLNSPGWIIHPIIHLNYVINFLLYDDEGDEPI
jgi:hypothetical protein